ncbi:MAG: ribbon-helix-helix domain-containing protein [Planctomycetia bacterium]|nr:ribbon-helix-helix domain-containing protein [Planctomycetia bacterium]
MTITLPDEMRDELERKAKAAGFASVSEYVWWLVRSDTVADVEPTPEDLGFASQAELEAKLLASINSGPPIRVTPEFWDEVRKDVATRSGGPADQP